MGSRVLARRDDVAVLLRILWTCVVRSSPRRAWLTLSMCLETAWRRPRAIRQAFTLALMHKHFYEYVHDTSRQLEVLIREVRESQPAG
jgi:lipopolysaccharide biosynthesis protein